MLKFNPAHRATALAGKLLTILIAVWLLAGCTVQTYSGPPPQGAMYYSGGYVPRQYVVTSAPCSGPMPYSPMNWYNGGVYVNGGAYVNGRPYNYVPVQGGGHPPHHGQGHPGHPGHGHGHHRGH